MFNLLLRVVLGGSMKTASLSVLMLSLLFVPAAYPAFYQWTDEAGVVHMTDDPDKVPRQYQDKARRLQLPDPPRAPAATAPAPQAAPRASAHKRPAPGGHEESWWRDRFSVLRGELKALQDARKQKEQQLVELRRKRTIFQRARDRQAVNAMQAEVAADEARIGEVMNKIAALELAASRAGVPAEWLR